MTTQAQIDANRLNAQQSTGPRTPEGKARSAQNALRHGLLAQQTIISDEDPEQFEALRQAMFEDLNPDGPFETLMVERIITQYWRLQRAIRMETSLLAVLNRNQCLSRGFTHTLHFFKKFAFPGKQEDADITEEVLLGLSVADDLAENQRILKLQQYETRIENGFYRALRQFHLFRAQKKKQAPKPQDDPAGAVSLNEPNFKIGNSAVVLPNEDNPLPPRAEEGSVRPPNEPNSLASDPCHSREGGNPDLTPAETNTLNEPNLDCAPIREDNPIDAFNASIASTEGVCQTPLNEPNIKIGNSAVVTTDEDNPLSP